MKFEDWIKQVISSGNLCSAYEDKVNKAASRLQLMRIVLNADGISFLCEMERSGFPLPYEVILDEFKYYINGKYKAEYINEKGNGYTSRLYCCHNGDIEIDTTLTCLLGCSIANLKIREGSIVKIYCDKNCIINIDCPESSHCIVEYSEGSQFNWDGGDNVELIKN